MRMQLRREPELGVIAENRTYDGMMDVDDCGRYLHFHDGDSLWLFN
jgi:hypothetical protein